VESSSSAVVVQDAPQILAPSDGASVSSPLRVSGQVQTPITAGAAVQVEMTELGMTTAVAGASATVQTDGTWTVELIYVEPVDGAPLQLHATHRSSAGISAATVLGVVQAVRTPGNFLVTQTASSELTGTQVYLQIFRGPNDVLDPIRTVELTATDGVPASLTVGPQLPEGTWYARAFRDSDGNGYPGLIGTAAAEAQSPTVAFTLPDTAQVELALRTPASAGSRFFMGDGAKAIHAAQRNDNARCQGFRMQVTLYAAGNLGDLAAPGVRLPNGELASMRNDGACNCSGGICGDNASGSFDEDAVDGTFTYGIPDPDSRLTGTYLLYYRNTTDDFVEVYSDEVSKVVQLPLALAPTSPTGEQHVTTLRPVIAWDPVPDATHYDVNIFGLDCAAVGLGVTTDLTDWRVPMNLVDKCSYVVSISPRVHQDLLDATSEVDAEVRDIQQFAFVVSTSVTDVVKLSGTILNDSGVAQPILLEAGGCRPNGPGSSTCPNGTASTALLPAGATTFSLDVLRSPTAGSGWVEASLGSPLLGFNTDVARASKGALDGTTGATEIELIFYKPLSILAPGNGETVSAQPTISWSDWDGAAGAEPAGFSYVAYANPPGVDGFPPVLWGVPRTTTSFNLASPPADRFDIHTLQDSQPSLDTLSPGSWEIGVGVLPCEFGAGDYQMCLAAALSSDSDVLLIQARVEVEVQ